MEDSNKEQESIKAELIAKCSKEIEETLAKHGCTIYADLKKEAGVYIPIAYVDVIK